MINELMSIDYLLLDILKYLDVKTLAFIRNVNKIFRNVIDQSNSILYDNYELIYFNDNNNQQNNKWLIKTIECNKVQKLNLLLCDNILLAQKLLKVVNPLYLLELIVPLAIFRSNTEILHFPQLKSLTVKNIYFNEGGMEYNVFLLSNLLSMINLQKIKLNSIKYISAEFIKYLKCNISYLDLKECMDFKIEDFELYLLKQKNTLKVLKLDGENSNINHLINIIPKLNQLTELSISYCESLPNQFLEMLSPITMNLRKLTLRKLRGITANCFENFFEGSNLNNMIKLDFYDASHLNDRAVGFIHKAKRLKYLDISWSDQVQNNSIINIMISCSKLQKIYLQGCKLLDELLFISFINDDSAFSSKIIAVYPQLFQNLQLINLTKCDLIPDKLINQFMKVYPWISIINYYGQDLKTNDYVF